LSIFICPQCGFKDSSIWRACSWLKYGVYTTFDELEVFYPQIAARLKEMEKTTKQGKVRLEDGYYVYRLTKNRFVLRMTKEIACEYSSHGFTEKPRRYEKTKQKLLLEVIEK